MFPFHSGAHIETLRNYTNMSNASLHILDVVSVTAELAKLYVRIFGRKLMEMHLPYPPDIGSRFRRTHGKFS